VSRELLACRLQRGTVFPITRLGPITPSRLGDRVPTRDGWYSKVPRRCPAAISFASSPPECHQYVSSISSLPRSSVPTLPASSHTSRIVAHIPRFHIVARFSHIVALSPRIVVLFPCFSRFPRFPIAQSRRAFRALPSVSWCLVPGAWFLIYLGGSPGHITCCPLNFRVLNPPLHVIPFPLFLSIPPVPSIYIVCIR